MKTKDIRTKGLKIVSGGQTGVDRAALDTGLSLGLGCGGWCPKGRRAEDGAISSRYPLVETPEEDYAQRTAWNVRDADATLILRRGPMSAGTALTLRLARLARKPRRVVDLGRPGPPERVRKWLSRHRVKVLNVAGPRESQRPGIGRQAEAFLRAVFSAPPTTKRRKA
jgi:hypothetical protein